MTRPGSFSANSLSSTTPAIIFPGAMLCIKLRCRISIARWRIMAAGSKAGSSVNTERSRFNKALATSVNSPGSRNQQSADILVISRATWPELSRLRLASPFSATTAAMRLVKSILSKRGLGSPMRMVTSAASSPRPSLMANSSRKTLSRKPGKRRVTIPKSKRAISSLSVRSTLPGCGSAWTKPSSKICFR